MTTMLAVMIEKSFCRMSMRTNVCVDSTPAGQRSCHLLNRSGAEADRELTYRKLMDDHLACASSAGSKAQDGRVDSQSHTQSKITVAK